MAEAIANLGINIRNGRFIKSTDMLQLRAAIEKELTRRGRSKPANPYTKDPQNGVFSMLTHFVGLVLDCKAIDSSKNFTVNQGKLVKAADFDAMTQYIQTLENQNTKS